MSTMNILHIQTSMGPAGNAAFRLHLAMRRNGINSNVLTYMPTVSRANVTNLKQTPSLLIKKLFNNTRSNQIRKDLVPNAYQYSMYPLMDSRVAKQALVQQADVIYLHWIAGNFMSLNDIEMIAKTGKKIFFFMHDMLTFTGGCHHSFLCDQYTTGCKECAMFKTNKDVPCKENERICKTFSKHTNLYFISPSKWMADCAKKSSILQGKQVIAIPNVVDEKIFKPSDKDFAKLALNIPTDKFIITFGCQAGTKNKFKGWDYLRDALNMIQQENIHCVIYGCDYIEETAAQLKHPTQFLGPIYDETALALICNASDLFVSPSLAESFGLTFLENIMCGTPVVGFDCTAIPETIHHGYNGYLAKYKDVTDLSNGIVSFITKKNTFKKEYLLSSSEIVKMHIDFIKKDI